MSETQDLKPEVPPAELERFCRQAAFWLAALVEMGGLNPKECDIKIRVEDTIVEHYNLAELMSAMGAAGLINEEAIASLFNGGITLVEDVTDDSTRH